MEKNKKYNIEEFYIGELYLYTNFANFISNTYNPKSNNQVQIFSQSGAINFQQEEISRYIDYENGREYTGFLTIFYKQGNKYICLHNGNSYQINGANFIKNLLPLTELLPKVNSKLLPEINPTRALELFDILFKSNNEEQLYNCSEQPLSDFFIGDLVLKEIEYQETQPDNGYNYIDLPHHIMLSKSGLATQSFQQANYINTIYRCLFLRQGVDLYNINNHQFYNHNEDTFTSIITFQDYMTEIGKPITSQTLSVPKALKRYKNTLR